jgi:hypothetical protein
VDGVYVRDLAKPAEQNAKKLVTGVLGGRVGFAPSSEDTQLGYLLFGRGDVASAAPGALMAQPFDLPKLEVVGDPVPLVDQVAAGDFSASRTGTLIYRTGAALRTGQLTLFDRSGTAVGIIGD